MENLGICELKKQLQNEKEEKEKIHQGIQRKLEEGNNIAEVELEGIRQGYLHEILP